MYYRTILPNGLRVLTEEISSVVSVAVGLWVNVGSKWESVTDAGISHFMEHLLFKGTTRRSAQQIAELMDSVGGQLNAFTSKEQTCYYARVLARHFGLALDVLADMYLDARLSADDIEHEKKVVLEEINMYEDSPNELIQDLLTQAVWARHPLGRPVLGTPESVANLTIAQIHAFRKRFYTPSNLLIAVAGNVRHEQVVDFCHRLFCAQKPAQIPQSDLDLPEFRSGLEVYPRDLEQVHICLGAPGIKSEDENRYVVDVANCILGGGLSSRLFQQIRERRGLAYSIYSYHTAYQDSGLFTVYAGVGRDNYPEVLDLVRQELEAMVSSPAPEQELERAKQQILGGFALGLESTTNRMMRLARNEIVLKRWVFPQEVQQKVEAVTAKDVQNLCCRLFGQRDLATVLLGPVAKEPMPCYSR